MTGHEISLDVSNSAPIVVGVAQGLLITCLYVGALVPWGAGPAPRAGLVLVCATAIVGTNVAGIRATSGAANLMAILKVAPLVLLGLAGLSILIGNMFVRRITSFRV